MVDRPYSNREIDRALAAISDKLKSISDHFPPFEKDVRESLSRVEMDVTNVRLHFEDSLAEERVKNSGLFSAKWVERGALALFTLIATSIVIRYWDGFLAILQSK